MKNVKAGHTRPIVCIDAGHYGKYNRSPAVPEYYESDMNWKLHLMLEEELEKYGIQVMLTRVDKNKDMDLVARGKASNGCDLFLSIHSNAAGSTVNESVDYVAVYHLTDDTTTIIDDQSKDLGKKIAPVIADLMATKQGSKAITRNASGDRNGDGIMNDNYYGVLHGARLVGTPGLILEHSFHTNTRATKWLMDDNNLRKMAVAEAKVVAEWFDVVKSGGTQPVEPQPTTNQVTVKLPVLKKGAKGAQVKALQALLIGYGYKMESNGVTYGVDGSFGGATDKAVRSYQVKNNLEADGSVGPATWSSLLGV